MLVLTRKCKQTIVIDDSIVITIVKLGRNSARLLVEAPHSVPIVRGELLDPPVGSPGLGEPRNIVGQRPAGSAAGREGAKRGRGGGKRPGSGMGRAAERTAGASHVSEDGVAYDLSRPDCYWRLAALNQPALI